MRYDVFISYSSKDKMIADGICHTLEEYGIMCWIAPRDVIPGERYAREIMRGIRESQIMVLVYSKNSNQSEHVANEIDRAFNEGKTIIPFLIDSTPMNDDFNYYLARKHWMIAYPNYSSKFRQLASSVALVVGKKLSKQVIDSSYVETIKSVKIRRDLYVRKIGDEYVVASNRLHLDKMITLNESAYYLWNKLESRMSFTLDEMAKLLIDEYDVTYEVAMDDCKMLLESWKSSSLVETI